MEKQYDTIIAAGKDAAIKGGELIRKGELVAFPTETVYGLGADATNAQAAAKIFLAKGRPCDNPLICHVACFSQIEEIAEITQTAKIAMRFMPGPITLVLPKKKSIPSIVTAGRDTVGVRMPSNKMAAEFLKCCGVAVCAPSANTSGKVSPTRASDVYEDMKGKIPLIIDGGSCQVGIESTVLDVTGEKPVILRPGAVTAEMLEEVFASVKTYGKKVVGAAPAPGMKYRHYAPVNETIIATSAQSAMDCYDEATAEGKKAVIVCGTKEAQIFGKRQLLCAGESIEEICACMFALLRDADKQFERLVVRDFGSRGLAASLMERLNKSAGGKRR